ncbi:cytochrome P450 4C1-like [Schistocerca americana]|uniref:cytochrome P450 4C1-like n=1 Tax=Schistocerca americana TaxID=7009 RepID=UPI001F4FFD54|nr:cytochrome P450 4C1-like [Schistocerca americana]XP_047102751.1 cytochrome P450 4C1-like [Schistocerca piceifrons]
MDIVVNILATVAVVLVIQQVWKLLKAQKQLASRLAHIPGPKGWPLLGNTFEFGKGNALDILHNSIRLWKTYGSTYLVWLGTRPFIFLIDADEVETILSSPTHIKKSISYKFVEPWLGQGLLTSDGNHWRKHRKIITPTFHFKILEEFINVFNSNGDVMIDLWKKKLNGPAFDIYSYVNLLTLDIINETAMGVSFNAQINSDSEYVHAVRSASDITLQRTFRPWLFPDFLFNLSSLGKEWRKHLHVMKTTTQTIIQNKKLQMSTEQGKSGNPNNNDNDVGQRKRMAFLDLLLQSPDKLSDKEIEDEVDTFMFAGHDTTASCTSFALWALAKHADVQEKAYSEIRELFGDSDRPATFRDLQEMKYLERVIKETLRLYSTVPLYARELDQELKIRNKLVPVGTTLVISTFHMNRNPEHFPNPETFDPDRFLPERMRGRHPYCFVPFSAGLRNCVGQKFALLEMKCTLSKVLRNFKLSTPQDELVLSPEIVMKSANNIMVCVEPRK